MIIFLELFIISLAFVNPAEECKMNSTKTVWNCCPGIEKIIRMETFKKCDSICHPNDVYCFENCFAFLTGILKNYQPDKETALNSLLKLVADSRAEWIDVSCQIFMIES
jgi:hypothetical protein